jgi:hypothetical protein
MGRPKRLATGSAAAGVAIEYVRTRKVIRVLGWVNDEPIEGVEIPIGELCGQLGIDPRDAGAKSRYLLFAGSHKRPAGGLRDLAGSFTDEDKAWAAFRALRQDHPATQGWAELAVVDGLGQVHQLAWFGLHPATDFATDVAGATGATGRAAPPRPRLAPAPSSAGYLRAVRPS